MEVSKKMPCRSEKMTSRDGKMLFEAKKIVFQGRKKPHLEGNRRQLRKDEKKKCSSGSTGN